MELGQKGTSDRPSIWGSLGQRGRFRSGRDFDELRMGEMIREPPAALPEHLGIGIQPGQGVYGAIGEEIVLDRDLNLSADLKR